MKKKIVSITLAVLIALSFCTRSEASLPVFDSANAALSELRNLLMKSQFVKDLSCALERLDQLKATYYELMRFHSGLDDFFDIVTGDPMKEILGLGGIRARSAFGDFEWISDALDLLGESSQPSDIRRFIEELTGEIPDCIERPYIPFEEMQVVEGFYYADKIRSAGEITREGARQIALQARTASPKGAARLQAEAMSEVMVLTQENQEALAKLIELQATSLEQVSRDEKRYERERLRYMDEFKESLEDLWRLR